MLCESLSVIESFRAIHALMRHLFFREHRPRQLLLRCSTTPHPCGYALLYHLHPCRRLCHLGNCSCVTLPPYILVGRSTAAYIAMDGVYAENAGAIFCLYVLGNCSMRYSTSCIHAVLYIKKGRITGLFKLLLMKNNYLSLFSICRMSFCHFLVSSSPRLPFCFSAFMSDLIRISACFTSAFTCFSSS